MDTQITRRPDDEPAADPPTEDQPGAPAMSAEVVPAQIYGTPEEMAMLFPHGRPQVGTIFAHMCVTCEDVEVDGAPKILVELVLVPVGVAKQQVGSGIVLPNGVRG